MTPPATARSRFDDSLTAAQRATAAALCAVIAEAAPGLVEDFKWNAPSFRDGAGHKVTLGVERSGAIRLVLHRGLQSRNTAGFAFADRAGLARWPAVDRGVITFANEAAVDAVRASLRDTIARWVVASR